MKHFQIWQWLVLASAIAFIVCSVSARDTKPESDLIEGSDLVQNTEQQTEVVQHEGHGLRVRRSKKSSSFEEDGGHKHGEDHWAKKGEKGDKGYKKKHHHDKGEKGHHDEKKAAGHHEEHGGHKKKKHEEDEEYKKHHAEEHHKKGGKKGHKKHHKKGKYKVTFHMTPRYVTTDSAFRTQNYRFPHEEAQGRIPQTPQILG